MALLAGLRWAAAGAVLAALLPLFGERLYAYVNPIIAVVLGTVLLSEPFTFRIFVAAAMVFGGIAVVRWTARPRESGVGRSLVKDAA